MRNNSKQIGGLIGPALMAIILSEFPLIQPHLYDEQIPPVVYLSGTLFFVGGLAIVRAHNYWKKEWSILITLSGWFALVLGLVRMFAAGSYVQDAKQTHVLVFISIEIILFLTGSIITYKSYLPEQRS